ncbi:MAG: glucose 1-dehydrogenase [Pseudomonadales bacterium]|jgi:NAD(P)-dependent dehydrogenase (short-subunit alcohol dehydrogenase family)|nr:glucose 1-dehydrogenase [Pseudomonadales bacterium]MDP7595209.1 glucose 1-dehydrogenase [Pseudomonadales bacterium]HJN53132.1 glucose 1-dehydrogenase [Pseudomonadales bacterium]|tara:strand:- start:1215 stop:2015 length:801 start_codon:yes stop_codon:yes gene_type:complete
MRLENRVAIVTGGARGIGEGISRCLAEEGARIAILDIDGDAAQKMAAELGSGHIGLAADISDEKEAGAAIDQVVKDCGHLDILVNNAGGGNRKAAKAAGPPFTRVEQEGWDEQMALNLRTTFAATKGALPHLKERDQGVIVNISSVAGLEPSPSMPAYAAAKAAVISLTKTLAVELGRNDIRVNAICPGLLYTRAWQVMAANMQKQNPRHADKTGHEVFMEIVRSSTPLGREQTPEDVGKLASFLCSDDARNITGQVIALDGGSSV